MRLLEPLALRGVVAPNRVLFGPHVTNLGRGRALSERHAAYYARRARGGAGIVVIEEASVHPSDWPYERAPLAAECGPGWAEIAARVHDHGGIALAALGHSGGQGSSAYSQRPLWAPSGVPEVTSREVPKAMEDEDIAEVVAGFAEAAGLAAAGPLDGVEVNAGQHSLVRQFLSGLTNLRTDGYGTDRLRFAREVLEATRRGLGPGHVLGLRLSCDELAPWAGITPDAAEGLAAALAPLVDYLVVVRGSIFSVAATRPDMHEPPGFNLDLCGRVRRAVTATGPTTTSGTGIAVVAQGSIVDPEQAENALVVGLADAVEMTRAQIADPDLAAKLAAREVERVRPCLLCNQRCQVRDNRNPLVTCVVEPRSGYEWHDPDPDPYPDPDSARESGPPPDPDAGREPGTPPGAGAGPRSGGLGAPDEVLVIGAGPAGLECARVLAGRGRPLVVAERRAAPGGWPSLAALARGRERLSLAGSWLEAECRRLGVRIDLGRAVDPAEAAHHSGPVVACTGGRDRPPEYEIVAGSHVVTAARLIGTVPEPPPGPVVVWDPVGGPVAVAVAEELAAAGFATTLLTPDVVVGTQLSLTGDLAPANVRLQQAGVRLVKRAVLRRVEPTRAVAADRFAGVDVLIDCAWLVDCGHRLPDATAWPPGVLVAGDAVAPRTIYEAVLEGRRAALAILAGPPRPPERSSPVGPRAVPGPGRRPPDPGSRPTSHAGAAP